MSFFIEATLRLPIESIPEKTTIGNPEVAFLGGVRNKSKIREVVGVGLWKRFSSAMISSLRVIERGKNGETPRCGFCSHERRG
jgi:hypothetical protein